MLKLSQSISPIRNNLETKKGHLQLKRLKNKENTFTNVLAIAQRYYLLTPHR
jgi:hypothetical protein